MKFVRHKDTNILYVAHATDKKHPWLIPVLDREVELTKKGAIWVPPKEALVFDEPEEEVEEDEIEQEDEGALFVLDKPVSYLAIPELDDLIEKIVKQFPEYDLELPEEPKRPDKVKAVSKALKFIKEIAEKENE